MLADIFNHYIRGRVVVTGGGGGRGSYGYGGQNSRMYPHVLPANLQGGVSHPHVKPWDVIDSAEAYTYSAWYRSLMILSQAVSGIVFEPKKIIKDGSSSRKEVDRQHPAFYPLCVRANDEQTPKEFIETMVWNAVEFGVSFAAIRKSQITGHIQLIPLVPYNTWKGRDEKTGELWYYFDAYGSREEKSIRLLKPEEVLEFSLPQPDCLIPLSPFWSARKALYEGIRAGAVRAAKSANNGRPGLALTTDQVLHPDTMTRIKHEFGSVHSGIEENFMPAVLDQGLKPVPIDFQSDAEETQSLWRIPLSDIANFTGVPTSLLADIQTKGSDTLEEDTNRFFMFGVEPWADKIVDQKKKRLLDETDILNGTATIEYQQDILRGVTGKTRMEMFRAFTGGMPGGTVNEGRSMFFNMEPLSEKDANKLVIPKNMGQDGAVNNMSKDGGRGSGRPERGTSAEGVALLNATVARVGGRILGGATQKAKDAKKFMAYLDTLTEAKTIDAAADEFAVVLAVVSPDVDATSMATEMLTLTKDRLLDVSGKVTAAKDLEQAVAKAGRTILQSWRRITKEKISDT